MDKKQLISYIGKGDIEHNGYTINVTKKDFDDVLKDFIKIELKPINDYTDGPIHTAFIEYVTDKDLFELERSLRKEFEIMKKQEKLMNEVPLKLKQISNISSNYEASFEDDSKRKYVLMLSNTKGTCELVLFDKEPLYSINKPIEIDGKIIKSKYSFWLESGIYNTKEFEKVLKKEYIEEKQNFEPICNTEHLIKELKKINILEYEELQKIAYRLQMFDENYTHELKEDILDKAEVIKFNNLDKIYNSGDGLKKELIEEIEDIAYNYGIELEDLEESESI